MQGLGRTGFKEAQAFWPRIHPTNPGDNACVVNASKRPRPFGPGYHGHDFGGSLFRGRLQRGPGLLAQDTFSLLQEYKDLWEGFKEAQAFWPRIHKPTRSWSSTWSWLQRGPGLLAQDTLLRLLDPDLQNRKLQRGPGLLAQDTSCVCVCGLQTIVASKRPRPFGPGYLNIRIGSFAGSE